MTSGFPSPVENFASWSYRRCVCSHLTLGVSVENANSVKSQTCCWQCSVSASGYPIPLEPPTSSQGFGPSWSLSVAQSWCCAHKHALALGIKLRAQRLTSWVTAHVLHLSDPPVVIYKRKIIRPTSELAFEDKYNSMHEVHSSGCAPERPAGRIKFLNFRI